MSHGGRQCGRRRVERKTPPGVASKPSQVVGRRDSIRLVTSAAEALPDDTDMLKAMLLAERAESERLRQIIKELQRHRFGRRAETLPEEQLQLGLEDVEQVEAAGHAESEANGLAERQERAARRRANRGALPAHLPRIETLVDIASKICPGCSGQLNALGADLAE